MGRAVVASSGVLVSIIRNLWSGVAAPAPAPPLSEGDQCMWKPLKGELSVWMCFPIVDGRRH